MSNKLNDFELIYLIKRKNEKAYEVLYERYRKYTFYKLKKYEFSEQHKEDIVQECMIEFNRVVLKFKEEYNILFSSFMDLVIERKIVKLMIKYYQNKNVVEYFIEEKNRELREDVISYDNNLEIYDIENKVKEFSLCLNDFERTVLKNVMIYKMSRKEFSSMYEVNEKKIYNTCQSIRKKFKKYYGLK